jgi:hypothetical protein
MSLEKLMAQKADLEKKIEAARQAEKLKTEAADFMAKHGLLFVPREQLFAELQAIAAKLGTVAGGSGDAGAGRRGRPKKDVPASASPEAA